MTVNGLFLYRFLCVCPSGSMWCLSYVQLVLMSPKVCQENIPRSITPPAVCWYKAGWMYAFMLFMSDFGSIIWTLQDKLKLITPGNIVVIFCHPITVSPCGFSFHLLAARSAPGLVFCFFSLSAAGFHMLCIRRRSSANIGCSISTFSEQCDHSPLTST